MPDEYIMRSDALKALSRGSGCDNICSRAIKRIPAADVAPVIHARWEVCDYPEPDGHGFVNHYTKGGLMCTNCRYGWKRGKVVKNRYCPHCGAKMDWEDDDGT